MFKAFNRWLGLGQGGLMEGEILGINMRNALIQKYNPRHAIERARDKVAAKRALEAAGIACTGTVAVLEDHQQHGQGAQAFDVAAQGVDRGGGCGVGHGAGESLGRCRERQG